MTSLCVLVKGKGKKNDHRPDFLQLTLHLCDELDRNGDLYTRRDVAHFGTEDVWLGWKKRKRKRKGKERDQSKLVKPKRERKVKCESNLAPRGTRHLLA